MIRDFEFRVLCVEFGAESLRCGLVLGNVMFEVPARGQPLTLCSWRSIPVHVGFIPDTFSMHERLEWYAVTITYHESFLPWAQGPHPFKT